MSVRHRQKVKPRPWPAGQTSPTRLWAIRLAALGLWALALLTAVALLGYQISDPTPKKAGAALIHNYLGLAGAWAAGLFYGLFGLAAWWLPVILTLAGLALWRLRQGSALLPLGAGWLWLSLVCASLLGLGGGGLNLTGGRLPLGGEGGAAVASSLQSLAGRGGAAATLAALLVVGLALVAWALRPALSAGATGLALAPRPQPAPRPPKPPVASPEPVPTPGPPPKREQTAAAAQEPQADPPAASPPAASPPAPETSSPDQPPSPNAASGGPRIKPRPDPEEPADPPPHAPAKRGAQGVYELPPLDLLQPAQGPRAPEQVEVLRANSQLLEKKLLDFGVQGQVVEVAPGPVVTMYEFKPAPGVKISKVAGLADDLAMNLKAHSIRIVAPIPGKAVIGIEIPSPVRETVFLRELLSSAAYQGASSPLAVALGKNILGQPVVDDLSRMPHLLIAGATGSGKSVFINTLVLSILYKATPAQVRLLMVDPKRIELSTYNDIPHLLYPIITAPKEATAGLRWAVAEMERRYELLAQAGVRNIASFNQRLEQDGLAAPSEGGLGGERSDPSHPGRMSLLPHILVIIDELADLMMVSSKEVEALITRLAQMARAAGIHLVLATQRPSVDVITGLIKANFPARISFQVSSRVDSRTILDTQGAEHLLGAGDMLFLPPGTAALRRLHGAFVSDGEIEAVVDFVKSQAAPQYDESVVSSALENENGGVGGEGVDERYADAVALVKQTGNASISHVQRRLRVGYNRAARMIEQMEADGIVGPSDGSRPREVLQRD